MAKYKVEINRTETFIVDVLCETEQEARDLATEKFADIKKAGMEHYHLIGDSVEETGLVYDVSNTDDPFNP
jgi:hypothetical protein